MKLVLVAGLLIAGILIAGCTSGVPQAEQNTASTIPDLTGTWTGSMASYSEAEGYVSYPAGSMKMTVVNQSGRIFNGTMIFTTGNQTPEICAFAGAIGRDGKTITIVNKNGGYDTGTVVSATEIELDYVNDGTQYILSVNTLRRS
ncbi:hypothetical protein [Methanoregula sp. UBA64]|jgi:hypothetical protein|uniref:hypothetical protein n=1 Tax=Methanoregula sp. UBA64 TaxID=1915554 RepID=UPI0025F87A46|nr:hypothetical protein [Methanoregula sp. UBA64]